MLADDLLQLLQARKIVIATVESCTGGLLASRITDVSGSSSNFWGSWGVYDNTAKQALGVPAGLIRQHGAVSRQVALSLADEGLRHLTWILRQSEARDINVSQPHQALAVISTTGIAGPTGGSPEKPVGLCYLGVAIAGREASWREVRAPAGLSRLEYKEHFTREAISYLVSSIQALPSGYKG